MGLVARLSVVMVTAAGLALGTLGSVPAAADTAGSEGQLTCSVAPASPVVTIMDTPVNGKVTCVHSGGRQDVTYSIQSYVIDEFGPFVGKLSFNKTNGDFRYTPGWYPPDEAGNHDRLPEYTGADSFTVNAVAGDGATASIEVPIRIQAPARTCDTGFAPTTRTMFNDPSGTPDEQYQMLRYLIKMIDCVPAKNPDGSQASIKFSFYSLSYAPVQAALSAAAQRGVAVQAITNSHSDKYGSWQVLTEDVGRDTSQASFATTCWQGCLTPRPGPVPGGPTAWYDADSTTLTSNTVVFSDRSLRGASDIVRWQYDFGDGTLVEGPGPHVHQYSVAGAYETSLTVTDANGLTHTTRGAKTLPDNEEPDYPSLHAKIYLFSTVGTGAQQRQWVSGYSSGNPTYYQSRKGFNNLNIAVADKTLYDIFDRYMGDLVSASRGQLFSANYFRTFSTPGNAASRAPATTVHLGPQTVDGDINRDIIRSIQCRYKVGKKWKHTMVRVSMFVFTRKGVAADLWKLAMREGCKVEIVYTQMSQRIKGPDGNWLVNDDGEPTGYGVADCLSTPPTRVVVKPATKRKPARRVIRKNNLKSPDGYCGGGSLSGYVPVTSTGMWLNRTSPFGGGRLRVRMSCPVAPKYDTTTKVWSVVCLRPDIYTHNKTMLVYGKIHGKRQKYVMSGSANWSSPGLRSSDEVITEIQNSPKLYNQYKKNYAYLKTVVARNSAPKPTKKKKKAQTYQLTLSGSQQLDVRGMTDAQLAGEN